MTLEEFENTLEGKRFFAKVEKTNSCWLWIAGKCDGYGAVLDGITKKSTRAHRIIMNRLFGNRKPGFEVCHKCNIKACVNPDHLYYGTRRDNIKDQLNAGVHNFLNQNNKGTKSPLSILTEDQVREIRFLRLSGLKYREISEKMNLNISTIGNVINNNRYSSVK